MTKKLLHKVKTGARLAKQLPRLPMVLKEHAQFRDERDRYYTERQILFDQSQNMRVFLANKYLHGRGIEIGPSYLPLPVPHEAKVRYVDIVSEDKLYEMYPDIRKHKLAHIDFVDNGETLGTFKSNSEDFIIANHFFEHTISPIDTLLNFYRVLKPGGDMYLAIPDKRFTFDINRPLTPLSRLIDYHQHPKHAEAGKFDMYLECAYYLTDIVGKKEQRAWAEKQYKEQYSIHYNVWTEHDILELMLYCIREFKLDLDFETVMKNQHEVIVILRKGTPKIKKPTKSKKKKRTR